MRDRKRARLSKPKIVFRGKLFSVEQQKGIYPNGTVKVFEYIRRCPSVSILAFDTKGRLLLLREYRETLAGWYWTLPRGRVDQEVSPREAAQRELREETGYRARHLKFFRMAAPHGSIRIDWYFYMAGELVHDPLPQDLGEELRVVPVTMKRAQRMCLEGAIQNETTAMMILRYSYARRHR
jgi:ADP-ribose diphosphatase